MYNSCSFFFDKDEKMQDKILSYANFKLFINEIIVYITITIKNDFEQYELNFSKIIHVTIKKYEQFFKKI